MRRTAMLVTLLVAAVGDRHVRRGLAVAVRSEARRHVRTEGAAPQLARRRAEGPLERAGRRGLRRAGDQRRQGLPARPGREGRRHAARLRLRQRQGAVDASPTPRRARFMFPGSRTTPTVDGDRVYTSGPLGDLHAIDTTSHKPVWRKNIWKDFGGGELPQWAVVQHPLIYGDLLIVAPQTPQAGVVAYDKLTGDAEVEVGAAVRDAELRQPVDREDRRRGSPGDDHRQRRTRPQRPGRQRHRPRSAHRASAVDLQGLAESHPGAAAGRRRATAACSSRAATAPAR